MYLQFYDADMDDFETFPTIVCLHVLNKYEISFSFLDASGCIDVRNCFLDDGDYFKLFNLDLDGGI